MSKFVRHATLGMAILATVAGAGFGADSAEKALELPYEFRFAETPLKDAMNFIANHYSIECELSTSVRKETQVTFRGNGDKLSDGLNLLLKPHKLGYSVIDDKLLVHPLVER
jgi:hypothetical protein